MSHDGRVKLGDFGLSRSLALPLEPMTPGVVTLWYRAPELLLGSTTYGNGVDIWACGCILGELLANEPLLPGKSETNQLSLIVNLLGTPNSDIWAGFDELPVVKIIKIDRQPYNNLRQRFPKVSNAGISLLNSLFVYDPTKRISASDALKSSYFKESPLPTPRALMPSFAEYRNM
ncbi:hypothetical protein ACOME3_003830 [Neoechinorhynchus agilis]